MNWKILKSGTTAEYKGERVKILEVLGNTAFIWKPSTQEEVSIDLDKLINFSPKPK